MRFSPDFIEKVRDANNIVDLFNEYTQLKRSGSRLTGLCPFPGHNEKTPSFSVSEDKQVYHCFGCQRSGQIFTALQELKGMSFPEAVEYLANRAGIILPKEAEISRADLEAKTRRETMFKINQFAVQFFHQQLKTLPTGHALRAYCARRGLTTELIDQFKLGFAPPAWEGLAQKLQAARAPLEVAAQLGLLRARKEGDGFFDLFRDRLMFPIYSQKGDCVGFGGRSLTDEQQPKYLNSPESDVFQKGQTFYGLHETAKFIRSAGSAIVVEGYMDFLVLYGAGIQNVVATLGTALTPHHARVLKRLTQNVLVLFDGDDAGQNAATRSLPILLQEELLPKAIFLPDQLDPDEFIKERGAPALRELMMTAPDLFSVVLDRHLLNYRGTSADKVTLVNEVMPFLEAAKDQRLKDLYVSEIAQKIGVEANWVRKGLSGAATAAPGGRAKVAENRPQLEPELPKDVDTEAKINLKGAPGTELVLLNLALMTSDRFKAVLAADIVEHVTHLGVKQMFAKAEARYRQMPNEFYKLPAYLMTLTDTPNFLGLQLGEPICSMTDEALDRYMNDCLRQVRDKYLRNRTRELAASLRMSSPSQQKEKLEQIMNIQISKHSLRRDRES